MSEVTLSDLDLFYRLLYIRFKRTILLLLLRKLVLAHAFLKPQVEMLVVVDKFGLNVVFELHYEISLLHQTHASP
jgi:hypothetical protein